MSILRTHKERRIPYVTIDTTALNDARLSFRAKGVHTYLMSKPDHWQVHIEQLEKSSPREGKDAIRSALKELLDAGYIRRQLARDEKGKMLGWETTVYETPALADAQDAQEGADPHIGLVDASPTSDEPTSVLPTSDEPTSVLPTSANPTLVSIDKKLVLTREIPSPLTSFEELSHACGDKEATCMTPRQLGTNPRARGTNPRATGTNPRTLQDNCELVLTYLIAVTGRAFRTSGEILGCLKRGATVSECCLVIDWWHDVKIVTQPAQADNFNHTTPFRAANFDKYRAEAEVWHAQGRPPPLSAHLSEKEQRTAQASIRLLEEYSHGRHRHAGVPRRVK